MADRGKDAGTDTFTFGVLICTGLMLFCLGVVVGYSNAAKGSPCTGELGFVSPAGIETLIDLGIPEAGGRVAYDVSRVLGGTGAYLPNGNKK